MKVVTFFNNKGGVGKTTTIINLASYLSIYREKKVLVVDLDPQSNSTQAILPEEIWLEFYDPENRNTRKTIYDYFRDMEEGMPILIILRFPSMKTKTVLKYH